MAERLNNHSLLPLQLDSLVNDGIVKIHPTLNCPDQLSNPVDVAIDLRASDLTPTGHRTLALPSWTIGEARIVAKGYFPSPVHVYGQKAREELARSLKFYSTEGEFAGKATEDDSLYEYKVLESLRRHNPEIIADPNVPIWQLVGVGFTGKEIKIWRENDKRPRKQAIVFRRFPYTQWRVADSFVTDDKTAVENELDRLQSIWNVGDRKGTYIKSISRLARSQGFLHNAGLPHGNLYWRWFDRNLQRAYGRPNSHNVAIDGSIGDFEKPDKLYRADELNTDVREAMGAFSIYASLVANLNPKLLDDEEFVSNAVQTYRSNLPYALRLKLHKSREAEQVIIDNENRLSTSQAGKKTRNGMEYFSDNFFSTHGSSIISLLGKLISK